MYQLQAVFACLAGFPQRLTHLFVCFQLHRQLLLLGKQCRWICQKIHLAKRRRKRLLAAGRFFHSTSNNSFSKFWRVHVLPFVTYLTWNSGSSKIEILSYWNTWKLHLLLALPVVGKQDLWEHSAGKDTEYWAIKIFCVSFCSSLCYNKTRL